MQRTACHIAVSCASDRIGIRPLLLSLDTLEQFSEISLEFFNNAPRTARVVTHSPNCRLHIFVANTICLDIELPPGGRTAADSDRRLLRESECGSTYSPSQLPILSISILGIRTSSDDNEFSPLSELRCLRVCPHTSVTSPPYLFFSGELVLWRLLLPA